ncbi:MAG: hypothetical protein JWR24_3011 [Actinoallomurus sp.]|nr:hypothetical protein [Actinoallomurus sp.]
MTLRILAEPRRVCIEVIDPGTASWGAPPEAQDEDECGRGLLIVGRLADRAGHESVAGGHISWAEVFWADARLDITPGTGERIRCLQDTRTCA